ncbi:6120_t:CDS:2, partial [Dentiscutata erythropus]
ENLGRDNRKRKATDYEYVKIDDINLPRDSMVDDYIDPKIKYEDGVNDIIFQHDGDSKHRAIDTKNWLYNRNLKFLNWPPYSPDLNIIGNLWGIVKQCLEKLHIQLWEQIKRIWDLIDNNIINNLFESMP